jgi:teichuronic acid biosynthesis glycosyltransferase TuaC
LKEWVAREVAEGVDVVHAHRLFPTAFAVSRYALPPSTPIVVSAVGSDVHTYPYRSESIHRLTEETIRRASAVIAVSQALADQVERLGRPRGRVQVAYRGVDTLQFSAGGGTRGPRENLGLPSIGFGICTVGRLVREKGVLELLDAFRGLVEDLPDAWLALVGDGPLQGEVIAYLERWGLEGQVFLPGARPHPEVAEWIGAADVFVLASHNEGLPNVVLEAMACGRPVVATRVGGVPEAVADGLTGYLVDTGAIEEIRTHCLRLARDRELREGMGTKGRERVQRVFTWDASTSRLVGIYEGLLRGDCPIASDTYQGG